MANIALNVLIADIMYQILYAYEDESGQDVVASLDFWSKAPQH